MFGDDDQCFKELKLVAGVKERLPELAALLAEMNRDYEDGIYRFYHGSFKVDVLQYSTEHAVEIVLALAPNPALDSRFVEIMLAGTGKEFFGENREVEPDAQARRGGVLPRPLFRRDALQVRRARRQLGRIAPQARADHRSAQAGETTLQSL